MTDLEVFINAPEDLTDAELSAYFDQVCGDDAVLRAGVEALVVAQRESTSFMEHTPVVDPVDADAATLLEQPGGVIGRYELIEQIGEGGFGTVWLAEQTEPVRRRVALKILKLGMDTKEVIARFEAERQALALMEHPSIARVHDAGATKAGRPFFVMELVDGIPITDFCDNHNLTTRERLVLFVSVCQAIQHAHQKGIVHRDIKPSNVLVSEQLGVPLPKVIDFGIAKATQQELTEKTLFTRRNQLIGTPAYMSPEQTETNGIDIDTRSDIYSLGVLLYELLTGSTPFDTKELLKLGLDEMRRIIREKDPVKPSTRLSKTLLKARETRPTARDPDLSADSRRRLQESIRLLKGDLDWIVMKSLEKDRSLRYDTPNSLAMDVNRHLVHEPVLAGPPSTVYRIRKAWRRNRLASTAALAVAVALIVGFTVSVWLATVATEAKVKAEIDQERAVAAEGKMEEALDLAEKNRDSAIQSATVLRKQVYVSSVGLAHKAVEDGDLGRARDLLSKVQPDPGEADLRGIEWRHLWNESRDRFEANLGSYVGYLSGVTISPDGQFVALNRLRPSRVEIIHLASGSVAKAIPTQSAIIPLSYSPSGDFLMGHLAGRILFWRTRDWKELEAAQLTYPFAFGYGGDQEFMVARDGDHLSLWNVTNSQSLGALENREPKAPLLDPSYGLWWHMTNVLAVSSDGDIAYLAGARKIRRWDLNKRIEIPALDVGGTACLATSSDGRLAAGDGIGNVFLIEPQTGEILHTFRSHRAWTTCLKFTADGARLVSASLDRNLVIHDPVRRSIVGRLLGHRGEVTALDISADGQTIVSGSDDFRVLLWPPIDSRNEPSDSDFVEAASVLKDGRVLVLRDNAKDLEYYDPVSGTPESAHAERLLDAMRAIQTEPMAFSPTARWAVSIVGPKLAVWNVAAGQLERSLEHPSGKIDGAIFSPDGDYLATGSGSSNARLWRTRDWTSAPLGQRVNASLNWAAFSRDRRRVAIVGQGEIIAVYDFEPKPHEIALPRGVDKLRGYSVALSSDGRWLAIGDGGPIHILDLESNTIAGMLNGHVQGVFSLSFSSDDQTLVSSSGSRVIFWHVDTWQELMRFRDSVSPRGAFVPRVEFSPRGHYLLRTGARSGELGNSFRVWPAPDFREFDEEDER